MKMLFEEYGDAILQILGGLAAVAIIIDLLHSGGALHQLLVKLFESAC